MCPCGAGCRCKCRLSPKARQPYEIADAKRLISIHEEQIAHGESVESNTKAIEMWRERLRKLSAPI